MELKYADAAQATALAALSEASLAGEGAAFRSSLDASTPLAASPAQQLVTSVLPWTPRLPTSPVASAGVLGAGALVVAAVAVAAWSLLRRPKAEEAAAGKVDTLRTEQQGLELQVKSREKPSRAVRSGSLMPGPESRAVLHVDRWIWIPHVEGYRHWGASSFISQAGQGTTPRPAPSRGSTGLAGVPARPAGLPHPWGTDILHSLTSEKRRRCSLFRR